MSDTSQGPGWWQASDGKWYPPEQAPGQPPPAPPGTRPGTPHAPHAPRPGFTPTPGGSPGPGWWQASDGNWYPPNQAPGAGWVPPAPGTYPPGYDPQAKSKVVAGILGILVGGLGIHRFYLGYTQIGIIQIVVTVLTCGLGALWGLVEGILILVGHEGFRTDADGRPLRD